MRYKFLAALLVMTCCAAASAYTWTAQTSGTRETLLGVHFIDARHGWAVGYHGAILHTTNGGLNWEAQVSNLDLPLMNIAAVDSQNAWVAGRGSALLHTTDGGANWTAQNLPSDPGFFDIWGMDFIDARRGFIAGIHEFIGGYIASTTDGGETWLRVDGVDPGLLILGLDFVDSLTGCAVGMVGGIGMTYDGGLTWTMQQTDILDDLYDVSLANPRKGWIVGYDISDWLNVLLRTTNSGTSWSIQYGNNDRQLTAVAAPDSNHLWISTDRNSMIASTRGGATWSDQTYPGPGTVWDLCFPDTAHGWGVGDSGLIVYYGPEVPAGDRSLSPPRAFELSAYPNPFNPVTTVTLNVPQTGHARLEVFDITGRRLDTLADDVLPAGLRTFTVDASAWPAGIYIVRAQWGAQSQTIKLVLLK